MARIKDKSKDEFKKYTLTEAEFEYVKQMHQARNRIFNEQGQVISAFLHYVAGARLGYKTQNNLEFQIDFEDDKKILLIKELQLPMEPDSLPQNPPVPKG